MPVLKFGIHRNVTPENGDEKLWKLEKVAKYILFLHIDAQSGPPVGRAQASLGLKKAPNMASFNFISLVPLRDILIIQKKKLSPIYDTID
jgi:hypothetical protein